MNYFTDLRKQIKEATDMSVLCNYNPNPTLDTLNQATDAIELRIAGLGSNCLSGSMSDWTEAFRENNLNPENKIEATSLFSYCENYIDTTVHLSFRYDMEETSDIFSCGTVPGGIKFVVINLPHSEMLFLQLDDPTEIFVSKAVGNVQVKYRNGWEKISDYVRTR